MQKCYHLQTFTPFVACIFQNSLLPSKYPICLLNHFPARAIIYIQRAKPFKAVRKYVFFENRQVPGLAVFVYLWLSLLTIKPIIINTMTKSSQSVMVCSLHKSKPLSPALCVMYSFPLLQTQLFPETINLLVACMKTGDPTSLVKSPVVINYSVRISCVVYLLL